MKNILFLGFGHLASFFLKQNHIHNITGTKRHADLNISCPILPFTLGEPWKGPNNFDIIIISFPPQKDYVIYLENLLKEVIARELTIFISSTSLFGSGEISESSPLQAVTPNAIELLNCEHFIKKIENYIIIRPGGLVDTLRHPKNFLKKSSIIKQSMTNVNLVHTYDVASFLHFLIDNKIINEEFNLVCDDHPTKEEFYSRFNQNLLFDPTNSNFRIINNSKSKSIGFNYRFNSLDWI